MFKCCNDIGLYDACVLTSDKDSKISISKFNLYTGKPSWGKRE